MLIDPVHSFRMLLREFGTLTRDRVVLGSDERAALEVLTEATPLQARALELARRSPLAA